jgi:predicted Zn-dependent protease
MQVHDFKGVCQMCRAAPNVVRRSHLLRHDQALAEAICGNRKGAITALERICEDKPRFPLSQLVLSELYLDTNQPERALELANRVAPRLPGDPGVPLLEARVLRRLGRLDEARAACDRALALDPEIGSIQAVAAVLAADRREFEQAEALLEKAFAMAPGDAYVLVVAAEIALQRDELEEAAAAIERAREAVRTNPLVFLEAELARLDEALADRLHPVVTENIFLE